MVMQFFLVTMAETKAVEPLVAVPAAIWASE
jgi:hypothetical protein